MHYIKLKKLTSTDFAHPHSRINKLVSDAAVYFIPSSLYLFVGLTHKIER